MESTYIKILLVDDDPIIITEVKSILEGLGKVFTATSGQSAVALSRDILPDLILLDIGLPDIDGFDVLTELNTNTELLDTEVIIITAHGDYENHLKSLNYGAIDFLAKPIDGHLLQKKIANIIKKRLLLKQEGSSQQSVMGDPKLPYNNVLSMMSEAVLITDKAGVIEVANTYANQMFSDSHEPLQKHHVSEYLPELNLEHFNSSALTKFKPHEILTPFFLVGITKEHSNIELEVNITAYEDNIGEHYLIFLRDISEKSYIQARLMKSALYDSLTGAYSLEALEIDTEHLLKVHKSGFVLACILDIDRFHEINTVFGYKHSNTILKELANKLRQQLINLPFRVYRVASDVFIIKSYRTILDSERENYKGRLNQIFAKLVASIDSSLSHKLSITAAICSFELDTLKRGAFVSMLEVALRECKQLGYIGELSCVDNSTYGKSVQLAELSQALLRGIDESTLDVVYQPQVAQTGKCHSAEALLRWNNIFFEPLTLQQYIEAAEDTGAIIDVGYYVLKEVCKTLQSSEDSMEISINLSIRQIADSHLVNNFILICERYKISPSRITIEMTESVMAENIKLLNSVLIQLKESGFKLSIDDFGTGQSNLGYINKLPIDEIKIDKSFIDDIKAYKAIHPVVDTIINMAKAMEIRVVAEGVETLAQVKYLSKKRCDLIQGYYFYKPMPRDQWLALFEELKQN